MSGRRLIYSTWPDSGAAAEAAAEVVEAGLAACANILPGVTSVFRWEGEIQTEVECVMFLKTTEEAAPALTARLAELHIYETPAIVCLAMEEDGSSADFLQWIGEEARAPAR